MKIIVCPICTSKSVELVGDGVIRCSVCGYLGDLSGKGLFKKTK